MQDLEDTPAAVGKLIGEKKKHNELAPMSKLKQSIDKSKIQVLSENFMKDE